MSLLLVLYLKIKHQNTWFFSWVRNSNRLSCRVRRVKLGWFKGAVFCLIRPCFWHFPGLPTFCWQVFRGWVVAFSESNIRCGYMKNTHVRALPWLQNWFGAFLVWSRASLANRWKEKLPCFGTAQQEQDKVLLVGTDGNKKAEMLQNKAWRKLHC